MAKCVNMQLQCKASSPSCCLPFLTCCLLPVQDRSRRQFVRIGLFSITIFSTSPSQCHFHNYIRERLSPLLTQLSNSQGGIGSNLKVGSHLGRTAWATLRWEMKLKLEVELILVRSGPVHHFLFGNQKHRCFDNCVNTEATVGGLSRLPFAYMNH